MRAPSREVFCIHVLQLDSMRRSVTATLALVVAVARPAAGRDSSEGNATLSELLAAAGLRHDALNELDELTCGGADRAPFLSRSMRSFVCVGVKRLSVIHLVTFGVVLSPLPRRPHPGSRQGWARAVTDGCQPLCVQVTSMHVRAYTRYTHAILVHKRPATCNTCGRRGR